MPDKTKAVLVKELAAANRRASKAEKALATASEEAEEGFEAATSKIAELEAIISGRSHDGDHVCPRTQASLAKDFDVYATEKRLRAERNDWRTFSGGVPGMRGTNELKPQASVPQSATQAMSSAPVKNESLLREERNAARKAAGGHSGQRGPNNTNPGQGLSTSARLQAEIDAWNNAAGAKAAVTEASEANVVAKPVSGDVIDTIVIEVTVRKA